MANRGRLHLAVSASHSGILGADYWSLIFFLKEIQNSLEDCAPEVFFFLLDETTALLT